MDPERKMIHGSASPEIGVPPQACSPNISETRKDALPQQAGAGPVNLLGTLPVEVREDIYKRVLVLADPIVLYQRDPPLIQEDGGFWEGLGRIRAEKLPSQWLALLRANRQIHNEAIVVVYSLNHFQFKDKYQGEHYSDLPRWKQRQNFFLRDFVSYVRPRTARLVSHVAVDFPVVLRERWRDNILIWEHDLHSLKVLRTKYTGLTTLRLRLRSRRLENVAETHMSDITLRWIQELLTQVKGQLKAIKKVTMLCWDPLDPLLVDFMEDLGWEVLVEPGREGRGGRSAVM